MGAGVTPGGRAGEGAGAGGWVSERLRGVTPDPAKRSRRWLSFLISIITCGN
jgi:hypothetical protein